jgi:RNA polymerase sigma-70 factor (subfamily 1)
MQPTTTFDLLGRAKGGEPDALSLLFEKYRRRLLVLCRYKLGPEQAARFDPDDLVQETLLRAHRDLSRFTYRSPGSFMHWLSTIADHVIADAARHEGRAKRQAAGLERLRSPSNPGGPEPADSLTPSRILHQDQRLRQLLAKLDALPPHYREALLLAKIEGMSTAETAERLGKPREAVALLVFRAVRRLRELLDSERSD